MVYLISSLDLERRLDSTTVSKYGDGLVDSWVLVDGSVGFEVSDARGLDERHGFVVLD